MAAGHVAGYGVATWAGLEKEAFTVWELLALAAEAAGGRHHLAAVQLPVSLVMMTPIVQALDGRGPLPAAAGAGLRVMASAPLHGGELPGPAWSWTSSASRSRDGPRRMSWPRICAPPPTPR
ncbi:hypothetical protein ACFY5K_34625 [Streptomyces griseofuscus]|uniref:hypothetical protein n=1 Tax=Streptomyces griseofuscus TaxID=146922 RepID=UPI0036B7EC7B